MVDPRWRIVLTVTPYLVLGMLAAFAVGVEREARPRLIPALILCAVVGSWMLVMRTVPTPWRDRPAAIAVFITVLIGLNLVLVLIDSWFAFLTIATFMFSYSIVPWPWELLAVGATAAVAGIAQGSGMWGQPGSVLGILALIALNIVIWCGLSWGLQLARRQLKVVATETERSRLAREIHDTLAQGFAGIVTQLQAAEQASDDTERRRHAEAALSLARDGLAEARHSVQALRPAALEVVRLPDALRTVARGWSARTGIPVEVGISGDAGSLRTDAEVALLRTTQEALTNVEKHAAARHVSLQLTADAHGCRLEVRDDGRGFDPSTSEADDTRTGEGGFGLVGMRERIEAVPDRSPSSRGRGGEPRCAHRCRRERADGVAACTAGEGHGMSDDSVSEGNAVRILVVDDHPVVRDGIIGMVSSDPGIEVVGEARDGAEAVGLARVLEPDVVLMDLRMPGMDGVAAIREFARLGIHARVVVLTTYDGDADVLPAIEAGATGYLLKDAPRDDLVRAIHSVARGEAVLAPTVASRLVNRVRTPEANTLTPRELEVLALVADGATNRAAGDRLHVSEATVKTHLLSIYTKLGVGDRAAAVAEGFRRGLLGG